MLSFAVICGIIGLYSIDQTDRFFSETCRYNAEVRVARDHAFERLGSIDEHYIPFMTGPAQKRLIDRDKAIQENEKEFDSIPLALHCVGR